MHLDINPSLKEILDDPIVVAVMTRDGTNREQVQELMERMRRRLRDRDGRRPDDQRPLAA